MMILDVVVAGNGDQRYALKRQNECSQEYKVQRRCGTTPDRTKAVGELLRIH